MTTPLHYAAVTYVFRLLGRGRAGGQRLPGSALAGALRALREEGQNALIEVELPSGSLGRLLVQVGRPVFVQYESKVAAEAYTELRADAADARLYLLKLSDEQIILACAALMGIPLALGEPLPAGTELAALLTQLEQQGFTGVVALEQGLQTLVWRFQRGRSLNKVKLPDKLKAGRLTQLVWQEQLLPEVGDAHTETLPTLGAVRTAGTTPISAQTSSPAPARAKAVQSPSAQVTAAQFTAAQPTAPHTAQTPFSSVAEQPQSFRRVLRPDTNTEEVWRRFHAVLRAQLGSRGDRVFQLVQGELSEFSRADLIGKLTLRVERLAGSAAARNFRDSF